VRSELKNVKKTLNFKLKYNDNAGLQWLQCAVNIHYIWGPEIHCTGRTVDNHIGTPAKFQPV